MGATEIRYAQAGEVQLAYTTRGEGPRDILFLPGGVIPLDVLDDEPRLARFLTGLERLGRVIMLNRRGIGLSDPVDPARPPTAQEWVDDYVAVLDVVGAQDVCVVAGLGDSKLAVLLAAQRPDLVTRLVTVNGAVRPVWIDLGIEQDAYERIRIDAQRPNRDPDEENDHLTMGNPSVARDPAFRAWWDAAGRRGASPSVAPALIGVLTVLDVTDAFEQLTAPMLVIQRPESRLPRSIGPWMVEHTRDARLVELAGADTLCWLDGDAVLAEIEDFLTGHRTAPAYDRRVLTVLFTDMVGSTAEAARRGDGEWRALLDHHDAGTRRVVDRYAGEVVKSTGDGVLARFDDPGQAVRAGAAIVRELAGAGIGLRVGIHAGEVELRGDDLAGLAVHVAARIEAEAVPGQVLVSRTVRDLLLGSTLTFTDAGEHELPGLPEPWALYALDG